VDTVPYGAGVPTLLESAGAIVAGETGSIYFAAAEKHQVFKLVNGASAELLAGTGVQGFSGDGGLATDAKLDTPSALALDATRAHLYIAESGSMSVRVVSLDQAPPTIFTVAGSGSGVPGFSGDGGPATQAELGRPLGLTVANNRLLIATDVEVALAMQLGDLSHVVDR